MGIKIKIPVKVNSKTEIKSKALGFDLKIVFTRINVRPKGMSVINSRIYVNDYITNTFDFAEWYMESNPDKVIPKILSNIFNPIFTKNLMVKLWRWENI